MVKTMFVKNSTGTETELGSGGGGNPFDQDLNTDDSVDFLDVNVDNGYSQEGKILSSFVPNDGILLGTEVSTTTGAYSTFIGKHTLINNTSNNIISIGYESGQNSTLGSDYAINIGNYAGMTDAKIGSINLGFNSGMDTPGEYSINIGFNSGKLETGDNTQIYNSSGIEQNNSMDNSILFNATNIVIDAKESDSFYIAPIRENLGTKALYYDPITKEVTYDNSTGGNPFDQNLNTTDSPTFNDLTLTSGTISTAPTNPTDIVNKTYADINNTIITDLVNRVTALENLIRSAPGNTIELNCTGVITGLWVMP